MSDRRATALRVWSVRLAICLLAALAPSGRPADAAPAAQAPENPFARLAQDLRLGSPTRFAGLGFVPIRMARSKQSGLEAHVGLEGAEVEIIDLPGPAGRWHVRVANRESTPLLIPAGDTLLTPAGPSRSADRPVWIEPGTATFLPVIQGVTSAPLGPYLCRGFGLTPTEQTLMFGDTWMARVRERNQAMGVPEHRVDDAGSAYVTERFRAFYEGIAGHLRSVAANEKTVGMFVARDDGVFFAHVETDAERFEAHWPFLAAGLALDAFHDRPNGPFGAEPPDKDTREAARHLLNALRGHPRHRPNFGEGWEYNWDLEEPHGHWHGLATADGPICLSYRCLDPSADPDAPEPRVGPEAPGETTRGRTEGSRGGRETEFERRLRERRERAGEGIGPGVQPPRPPLDGGAPPPSEPPRQPDPPQVPGSSPGPRSGPQLPPVPGVGPGGSSPPSRGLPR